MGRRQRRGRPALALAGLWLALAACGPATGADGVSPSPTPADLWGRLLAQAPYPYTTPLPPAQGTAVDGVYGKVDPREGTRPFCLRCMPYPAEGGLWRLQLEKGAYRILAARSLSGWRSLGSYAVSGDRLALFNDPHCLEDVGHYTWRLEGDRLLLSLVEDACADGWRGITFTNYPWIRGLTETAP
jgi:hypothetical protein